MPRLITSRPVRRCSTCAGVDEFRAVAIRREQPVPLPLGIRVAEQRDVIARHGARLRGLREDLGDVGKVRMQVEREVRQEQPQYEKARDEVRHRERSNEQQRIGERRTDRRSHAALSPNDPVLSMCRRFAPFRRGPGPLKAARKHRDRHMTVSPQDQARILIEALPHMQRYDEETVVVKYGGHAMGDEAMARSFAQRHRADGADRRSIRSWCMAAGRRSATC